MPDVKKFMKELIPEFFHRNDSYKDSNQEGLLIRFLDLLGEEVDNSIIPKIENYLEIREIDITDGKFIEYLSDFYGNPPSILTDVEYRALLKYITSLYKIKGTRRAFEIYFSILGLNIKLSEYWVVPSNYDEFNFDEDKHYDQDGCEPCSEYDIWFWDKTADCANPTITPFDKTLLDKLHKVVILNQPINAKLRALTHTLPLCEQFRICVNQEITWEVLKASKYDLFSFDDAVNYDTYTSLSTGSVEDYNCGFAPSMSASEVTSGDLANLIFNGLLDEHTDSVLGLSLRYLKSTTTNVIKCRRTVDQYEQWFTPLEVYNGSLLTWGKNTTVHITEWLDQQNNISYQFTVPDKQPLIIENGVMVMNQGHPGVKFRADMLSTLMALNNYHNLSTGVTMYTVMTEIQGYGEDNRAPLFGIGDNSSHTDGDMVFGVSINGADTLITLDGVTLSRASLGSVAPFSRKFVATSIDVNHIVNNIAASNLNSPGGREANSDTIPVETLLNGSTVTQAFQDNRLVDSDYMNTVHNSVTQSDYGSVIVNEIIVFRGNHDIPTMQVIQGKQQAYF